VGKGHVKNKHHNYNSEAKTNTYSDSNRKQLYVSDAVAGSRTVTISYPAISHLRFAPTTAFSFLFRIIGAIVQLKKKNTQWKSQNVKQLFSRNPQVFRPQLFSNWEFWLVAVFRKVDRYIFARLNLHWIQDNETVSELPEDVEFVTRVNDEHCQLICKNSALNLNEMYLWKKICRTHQLGRKFIAFISLLSKTIALLGYFKKLIIRKLIPTSTQMNFCNPSLQVNKRKNVLKQNSWWCLVKRRNWKVWLYCIFCCKLQKARWAILFKDRLVNILT